MLATPVQSAVMAKRADASTPVSPDDEVRYTGLMTRRDRARFKAYCEQHGLEMERVGPEWIMERLAQVETAKPKR